MSVHQLPVDQEAALRAAVANAPTVTAKIDAQLDLLRWINARIEEQHIGIGWTAPDGAPLPATVLPFRPRST